MALEKGYRHPDQDFHQFLKRQSGLVWLDLGCGSNFFIRYHRRHFKVAFGLDGDLRLLKRPESERPDIIGDVRRLPIKAEALDLVSAYMVVEHFEGSDQELREISRTLKPGAHFICATVNKRFWGSVLNNMLPESLKRILLKSLLDQAEEDVYPAHYKLNDRRSIQKALMKNGIPLETWKEFRAYYPVSIPAFWAQHWIFGKILKHAALGISNFNFVGQKKSSPA